ncbi:MAG: alpha/beta hydrolase [Chlorobiaceae bacterium]|nr:alpha/beta hydrolase [Chlorobiaceae bacterium]
MHNIDHIIFSLVPGAVVSILLSIVLARFAAFRWRFAIPLGLVAGVVLAVVLSQWLAFTPPITGKDGRPLPGSVAVMEEVTLNGRKEWVVIRGHDQTKPVLLFVSGGPVGSELGWVKRYNADLEKEFVVVVWEEPGGGKSYPAVNWKTVKVKDYVDDGIELTRWLRSRFHKEKIYLVGHSWGSLLTVWMVQRNPEFYHALVNVGQMVNPDENDRFGYRFSLEAARKAGDAKVVTELEKNGPPPYGEGGAFRYNAYLNNAHGVNLLMEKAERSREYLRDFFPSGYNIPEYGLLDRVYWFLGLIQGMNHIYSPQLDQVDLIRQARKLDVPVYFATGRYDYNAWYELAERYFNVLEAPKKEMIWFEDSGHSLNYSEPGKFMNLMRRVQAGNPE